MRPEGPALPLPRQVSATSSALMTRLSSLDDALMEVAINFRPFGPLTE